ncbi:MAG: ATP-binding cassette domain-containing protein [Polyangiaceae bacterium]|nr:ATP-binding cassette domain-containing protein [Polyangiaceae bacterium]
MSAPGAARAPEPTPPAPVLEVERLRVTFPVRRGVLGRRVGTLVAVDDVSFALRPGRTLGLVGESGCGKSTLGRAILRLCEAESGRVAVDGVDVRALTGERLRRARRKMQMIFQDPYASLDPRRTVLDCVAEPLTVHGLAPSRRAALPAVTRLLERVGLEASHLGRYPHELSGGQRQRVGIARALALEPLLIVADEPVSALDMSIRAQIVNLLVELQRELGLAYLFIAHDLALVRYVSHEVAVMYLGRVVEHAPVRALFARPFHPYTHALLASAPVPDPDAERGRRRLVLAGEPPSPLEPPTGCAFHPRCPHAEARCAEERPELRTVGDGHRAACHLEAPRAWPASAEGA